MSQKEHLVYADSIGSSTYRLLEVPNDLLAQLKADPSKSLVIKGRPEEEALLCTDNQTFAVRLAVSSNTLLLVPPSTRKNEEGEEILDVVASITSHYELSKVAPRLHTLKGILEATAYHGTDEEESFDKTKLCTFEELSRQVQASNEELREKLREINAMELNGYWRLLDTDFTTQAIDLILTNAVAKSWSLSKLDSDLLGKEMGDYDPFVLKHILHSIGSCEKGIWNLDLTKISIFRASQLLRELLGDQSSSTLKQTKQRALDVQSLGSGKDWRSTDFFAAWQDSVPDGAPVDISLLTGIAISGKIGSETFIRYLPASEVKNIPDPRDRVRLLFKVLPFWKLQELAPYLSDLAKDTTALESLLVKNARPIMQDGVRVYCSRE